MKAQNKRFKMLIIVICTLASLFILFGMIMFCFPLLRSDKGVRNYVLKRIPIGTELETVEKIVEKKGWNIIHFYDDNGIIITDKATYLRIASDDDMVNGTRNPDNQVVGAKTLEVQLGEYKLITIVDVIAYLSFDDNDRLVEVGISHEVDSP